MLTTGVRLRGNAEAQRALVPQLEAGGASALGFGVGLGFKRVPPALVESPREHDFPVFAVPYETPFREIIRFVDSALTSGEEHVFRRLTALQRYLVDALRTAQPERAMVERLARFLDASVVLMSADGEPAAVAGRPPARELLRRSRAEPPGLLELEAGGWHAVATPVVTRADQAERWLRAGQPAARLHRQARASPPPRRPRRCSPRWRGLGDVVREQEQAVKAALLAEALEPAGGPRPAAAGGPRGGLRARLLAARPARRGARRRGAARLARASSSPSSTARTSRISRTRARLPDGARAGRRGAR